MFQDTPPYLIPVCICTTENIHHSLFRQCSFDFEHSISNIGSNPFVVLSRSPAITFWFYPSFFITSNLLSMSFFLLRHIKVHVGTNSTAPSESSGEAEEQPFESNIQIKRCRFPIGSNRLTDLTEEFNNFFFSGS